MTWAGQRSEHFCSFQSPGMFFLLTLPFIERANRPSGYWDGLLRQSSRSLDFVNFQDVTKKFSTEGVAVFLAVPAVLALNPQLSCGCAR